MRVEASSSVGNVYSLREVLQSVPLPNGFSAETVSSKWRCVLVPRVSESGSLYDEKVMAYLEQGMPVFTNGSEQQGAAKKTGNQGQQEEAIDGVSVVMSEVYNTFERPQISIRNGWGGPGTARDQSNYHVMVKSFSNVFQPETRSQLKDDAVIAEVMKAAEVPEGEEAPPGDAVPPSLASEILQLQLFHRDELQLPPAANALNWPDALEHKVVCDVGTVASQRGFQRWWGLNDCGEFVLEGALPVKKIDGWAPSPEVAGSSLYETNAPCKLYLFGPKGSYDWFVHDESALTCGSTVVMDIFSTSDEELPEAHQLPVLIVCVVEGGGPSLIIPPNLPTMHIILQDCVTVEQRALSFLWLDDVSYFLYRCRLWASDPLVYPFVEEDLQDEEYMTGVLIPLLNELFSQCSRQASSFSKMLQRRIVTSLYAIASQPTHYAVAESSRASLLSTVSKDNTDMASILRSHTIFSGSKPFTQTLMNYLSLYWSIGSMWPKAGCVLRPIDFVQVMGNSAEPDVFIPVVYPPSQSRPVYGSAAPSAEATLSEYCVMKNLEGKPSELLAYLKTRKNPRDSLLDDLF